MGEYILTIDVGTTSIKTVIFDMEFEAVASESVEYDLICGVNNTIEMDANDYLRYITQAVRSMLDGRGDLAMGIVAIISTTQGETITPVDKDGVPLRNAIVWLDGRAETQGEYLEKRFPTQDLYPVTGVTGMNGAVPVAKVLWIKDNEPEVFKNTYKFLLLEDLINQWLTGRFITEKVLLSSTGYYDIIHDVYYDEILEYINVSNALFPEFYESGTLVGRILPDIADVLGINRDAVVYLGAMDQACSALAAGSIREGIVTETTGTALVITSLSKKPDFYDSRRAIIYRSIIPGHFMVIPICMTAGMILKWFRDEFVQEKGEKKVPYTELDCMALKVPAGAEGLFMLPYFTGIITPENNPNARGVLFGLELSMKIQHYVRAIYESIGYMLRENLELVEDVTGNKITCINSLGGGSKGDIWLQIKADICDIQVNRMQYPECTSLGAAIIAAVAMGRYENYAQAILIANTISDSFYSNISHRAVYDAGYHTFQALYTALKPVFDRSAMDKKNLYS